MPVNREKVFKQLFEAYYDQVFHFAIKRIQDQQHAEDIAQTVFLNLWKRQDLLTQQQVTEPLIYAIAKNAVMDHFRQKLKLSIQDEKELPNVAVEEINELDDRQEALEQAIAKLPQKRRQVLELSRFNGMTYKEIGAELGISPKTVENQIASAIKHLRKKLT